ncbi:hypothetical protein ILYODFUR_023219, partial [Ilyodon furcidens]
TAGGNPERTEIQTAEAGGWTGWHGSRHGDPGQRGRLKNGEIKGRGEQREKPDLSSGESWTMWPDYRSESHLNAHLYSLMCCADERDRVQKKTFTKWVNKHLIKGAVGCHCAVPKSIQGLRVLLRDPEWQATRDFQSSRAATLLLLNASLLQPTWIKQLNSLLSIHSALQRPDNQVNARFI